MRIRTIAGLGVAAWLLAASSASAEVRLTMQNGHVSLVAKDATLGQILAEWARVGQTKILNAEKLAGGLVSLELANVPERQALDVLLRSISGYLLAPRAAAAPNLSQFDRIILMPTSAAPRAAAAGPSAGGGGAVFPQPQQGQPAAVDDDNGPSLPPPRGPVFTPFPQPQQGANFPQGPVPFDSQGPQASPVASPPPTTGAVATFPGAPTGASPAGTSRPGEIAPAPPAQPTAPGSQERPPQQ